MLKTMTLTINLKPLVVRLKLMKPYVMYIVHVIYGVIVVAIAAGLTLSSRIITIVLRLNLYNLLLRDTNNRHIMY